MIYFSESSGFYSGDLRAGDREATEEEIAALEREQAISALRGDIARLEREEMMPHGIRVFVIESLEREAVLAGAARTPALTAAQSKALLRAGNSGYRRVIEFHELISSMEAQIAALGG